MRMYRTTAAILAAGALLLAGCGNDDDVTTTDTTPTTEVMVEDTVAPVTEPADVMEEKSGDVMTESTEAGH